MTFRQTKTVSIWLSRIGTACALGLVVTAMFFPPIRALLLGYAAWFALGAVSNNMWARWLERLAVRQEAHERRKAWLDAVRR